MKLFFESVKRKINKVAAELSGNNKGFSLMEVLIAMVILAIVTLPILSSFASAGKINARARRQENANTVAQKVIEEFKALSITQLTDGSVKVSKDTLNNSSTGVAGFKVTAPGVGSTIPADQLSYLFKMASFTGSTPKTYTSAGVDCPYIDGANGERFFVDVTLDPASYADKSVAGPVADVTYNNINTYDMPEFSDVLAQNNIVFQQEIFLHDAYIIGDFKAKGVSGLTNADIRKKVSINTEVVATGTTVNLKTGEVDPITSNDIKKDYNIYSQNTVCKVSYINTKVSESDPNSTLTYTFTIQNTRVIENAEKLNELNVLSGTAAYNQFKNVYLFYKPYDIYEPATSPNIAVASDIINVSYNYPTDIVNGIRTDKLNVYLVEANAENVNVSTNKTVRLDRNNVHVWVNKNPDTTTYFNLTMTGTLGLDGLTNTGVGKVNIYSNIKDWNSFKTAEVQKNGMTQNSTPSETKYLYNIKVEIWVGEKTGSPFMTVNSTKEN